MKFSIDYKKQDRKLKAERGRGGDRERGRDKEDKGEFTSVFCLLPPAPCLLPPT
jgi:hypothetical protein